MGKKKLYLSDIINRQLISLLDNAPLSTKIVEQTVCLFKLFSNKSLNRELGESYEGLSHINSSGLPFQWCLNFGQKVPSIRFLCEAGNPGDSPHLRLSYSLELLKQAFTILSIPFPQWLWDSFFNQVLPKEDCWPQHWRSALWFGIGAFPEGIVIKPYVNLNRDPPLLRWERMGWILKLLGKPKSLSRLCDISSKVSPNSWPVGIAIDVLPNGSPGRLKIYFHSLSVKTDWLQVWYEAAGAEFFYPDVRDFLDAFPWCGQKPYIPKSFIISLEFHIKDGELSLKTDLGLNRWLNSDYNIFQGICHLNNGKNINKEQIISSFKSIFAWPLSNEKIQYIRFVGLGYEPNGASHYNIYIEPPLNSKPEINTSYIKQNKTLNMTIEKALSYIFSKIDGNKWNDFSLPVGESDRWVSAYILYQLFSVSENFLISKINERLKKSIGWLKYALSANGAWGYNEFTPDDCDSTSFAILALRRHYFTIPFKTIKFIKSCYGKNGGFATYPPDNIPGGSWIEEIPEITSVVLLAFKEKLSREEKNLSINYLANKQLNDGSWQSYWWLSPLYATLWSLACLLKVQKLPNKSKLIKYLLNYSPNGAFETALLILCLSQLGLFNDCVPFIDQLMGEQQKNGSWAPSAYLRLSDPCITEPWRYINSGNIFVDQHSLFTTVTVISALTRQKSLLNQRR